MRRVVIRPQRSALDSYYYFTKVRYAGRFEHTQKQGAPSAG